MDRDRSVIVGMIDNGLGAVDYDVQVSFLYICRGKVRRRLVKNETEVIEEMLCRYIDIQSP